MKLLLLLSVIYLISFISFSQNQITWNIQADVATSNYGNNFPRVVKDGFGSPIVSWSNNSNMYLSTWNGSNFDAPIQLNPSGVNIAGPGWMGPDIASKGDTIYAVYKQTPEIDTSSHVWCVRSFDGGSTFDTPVRVEYIGTNISRFPTVSVDEQGHPVIGFMEFTSSLADPQWVVVRSNDFGSSFNNPAIASGWSSPTSEVCDCCPSKIVSDGNTTVMPYRDNNSNVRDTWVGVSNDGGLTFPSGMPLDQLNWVINACPSSGPDAVIVGDNLYTTFMSGSSGARAYYSVSSLSGMTGSYAIPLDQITPVNLSQQNYPRVDYHAGAMVFAWKQLADGNEQVAIQFTEDLTLGVNTVQEVVNTSGNPSSVDVMLNSGMIWVVWDDEASGTVRYRSGQYSQLGIHSLSDQNDFKFYPNPTSTSWTLAGEGVKFLQVELLSSQGKVLVHFSEFNNGIKIETKDLDPGVYFARVKTEFNDKVIKLIKQ